MDYDDDDLVEDYRRARAHLAQVQDFHVNAMTWLLVAMGIVPLFPFILIGVFLLALVLLP